MAAYHVSRIDVPGALYASGVSHLTNSGNASGIYGAGHAAPFPYALRYTLSAHHYTTGLPYYQFDPASGGRITAADDLGDASTGVLPDGGMYIDYQGHVTRYAAAYHPAAIAPSGHWVAGEVVSASPFDAIVIWHDGQPVTEFASTGKTLAAVAVNDLGHMVGSQIASGHISSFLEADLHVTPLLVPGATETDALALNLHDAVVGSFSDGLHQHGFIYQQHGGYEEFDITGASDTIIQTINDSGEIGGTYRSDDGQSHGFLADPHHMPSAGGVSLGVMHDMPIHFIVIPSVTG